MVLKYTAQAADNGRNVYSIMRRNLRISAVLTRRLKQVDGIFVDGESAFTNRIVSPGETVSIDITAAEPLCDILPEQGSLDILYEDDGLLAVNKPAGLLTHPSRSRYTGTLANFVAGYLDETTGDSRCHAVNRLDRDTSGVVLFSKNSYMKALAAEALARDDAQKDYLAVVYSVMEPRDGTIDLPIARLQELDMRRIVSPEGQRAVTHYKTLASKTHASGPLSLLSLTLETGRTHQIRVHCHHLGHPLLGDILYHTTQSSATSQQHGIQTQALHAHRLSFVHPLTGTPIVIAAPVPADIRRIQHLLCYVE